MYVILVRHVVFFKTINPVKGEETWLYSWVSSWIPSGFVQNIFAVFIIWIQAILINNMCIEHKLSRENTLFPGLFYALLISFIPESLALHPILLANTFLIAGFANIIHSAKQVDIRHFLFNAGFFLILAVMFYPSYILFILIGLFGFYSIKSLKPMENLQFITGILSGIILVLGLQFLIYNSWEFHLFFSPVWKTGITALSTLPAWIFIIMMVLVLIASIGFYPDLISKKNIQTRKKIELIYLIQISMLISVVFFFHGQILEVLLVAFPVGMLTGLRLSEIRSHVFAEVVHLILLTGLLLNHYLS